MRNHQNTNQHIMKNIIFQCICKSMCIIIPHFMFHSIFPPFIKTIYFSLTAYASAANGDTIPKSVNICHTKHYLLFKHTVTKQTLLRQSGNIFRKICLVLHPFAILPTSFRSHSITLTVSNYVVADRLFGFFLVSLM